MKTTIDMMQKPELETTIEIKNAHKSSRWNKRVVIGAIAVLLAISTVVAVITFVQVQRVKDLLEAHGDEKKMDVERTTAEDSKLIKDEDTVEANITFHLPLLNKTIEQKVVVTSDEEDVTTPEQRTIYDYNRGYVVTHFERDGDGTVTDICFVRKFTPHENIGIIKAIVKAEKKRQMVRKINEYRNPEYMLNE